MCAMVVPTKAGPCPVCKQEEWGPERETPVYKARRFHLRCFKCKKCGKQFKYEQADNHTVEAVGPFPHCLGCAGDVVKTSCGRCGEFLSGRSVVIDGKKWHFTCFKCALCDEPFGTGPYTIRQGDYVHGTCPGQAQDKSHLMYRPAELQKMETKAAATHAAAAQTTVISGRSATLPACGKCGWTGAGKFCQSCGNAMGGAAAASASAGGCGKCGTPKTAGKFCGQCGEKY